MGKSNFKFITTFCIFIFLAIITTAAKLNTDLKVETVTFNAKTGAIDSYNYEQGVYCQSVGRDGLGYEYSGISLPKPTKQYVDKLRATKNENKRPCVFVNKFQTDKNFLFGQFEDDDNWYVLNISIDAQETKMMVRVKTEQELQLPKNEDKKLSVYKTSFIRAKIRDGREYKNLQTKLIQKENAYENLQTKLNKKEKVYETQRKEKEKTYENLQTKLNEKEQAYENLQTQLNEKEKTYENSQNTSKYYGYAVIILGILVLVLILMLIFTSTSPDSNINRKFKVGNRVKVRNSKQQEWRTGMVKQSLKVEVDGWQKAHIWNYVEHIVPVSENTKIHSDETPKSNDLTKNITEKKTNNSNNSKKKLVKTNSSSNADQNESDEKTAPYLIYEVTEDNTMTPSEDNTENEENTFVNTITNSVHTLNNINSS